MNWNPYRGIDLLFGICKSKRFSGINYTNISLDLSLSASKSSVGFFKELKIISPEARQQGRFLHTDETTTSSVQASSDVSNFLFEKAYTNHSTVDLSIIFVRMPC